MESYKLIHAKDKKRWMDALLLCGEFDTYHLPGYHLLAEYRGEGKPFLFLFNEKDYYAALPFLLRRVSEIKGLQDYQYMDVASVYGYPGIISSKKTQDDGIDIFKSKFQSALYQAFNDLNVITFFCRLNPLINTSWLLHGMAEVIPLSHTISIDLNKSEQDQIKDMTKGHRYDIRKARREGLIVRQDESFESIHNFIRIYNETMKRTGADNYYFFEKEYYLKLQKLLGDSLKLFVAEKAGTIISAALFLVTGKIIQYHLSGTPERYLHYCGAKVILDEVRKWGKERGFSCLHLGGGVKSQKDSLFLFKAGFSKSRHRYEIARIVLKPDIYLELIHKRNRWEIENGFVPLLNNYFPQYRRNSIQTDKK